MNKKTKARHLQRTEMLGCDVLQACTAHCARTEHDLARSRIECLQELDHAAHSVRSQETEVHDDLEIIREQDQCLLRRGDSKVAAFLDTDMFAWLR